MRVNTCVVMIFVQEALVLDRTICVTVCVTVGNTICLIRAFNRPVLIDAFFKEQRKSNHQIYITGSLIPKDISKLVCNPSIVPIPSLIK